MTGSSSDDSPMPSADASGPPLPSADVSGSPPEGSGNGTADQPRYRGWFWLGIVLQVCAWTLIWLGIAIAIGVGGELTEFRYVGF